MEKREGWGWHDMASWQTFFDTIYEIGQITKPIKAEDVCTNAVHRAANDFDHEKVKADADAFELSADMQALDMEAIQAGLFDASIQG